jgi:hypothetical protein
MSWEAALADLQPGVEVVPKANGELVALFADMTAKETAAEHGVPAVVELRVPCVSPPAFAGDVVRVSGFTGVEIDPALCSSYAQLVSADFFGPNQDYTVYLSEIPPSDSDDDGMLRGEVRYWFPNDAKKNAEANAKKEAKKEAEKAKKEAKPRSEVVREP